VGVCCLIAGHTLVADNKVFVIMGGIPWAIQLLSASRPALMARLTGAVSGSIVAFFTLSVLSASTNNVAVYLSVICLIMGTIGYLGSRFPSFKPGCAQFAVSFMIPTSMLPGPMQNFHQPLAIIEAMWIGIILASLLYFLHQWLLSVEKIVEDSGRTEAGG
jgi:hypothetical protein